MHVLKYTDNRHNNHLVCVVQCLGLCDSTVTQSHWQQQLSMLAWSLSLVVLIGIHNTHAISYHIIVHDFSYNCQTHLSVIKVSDLCMLFQLHSWMYVNTVLSMCGKM
jgi:hypothetical protein